MRIGAGASLCSNTAMSSETTPLLISATANDPHPENGILETRGRPLQVALSSSALSTLRRLVTALTAYISLHEPQSQATRGVLDSWTKSNFKKSRCEELDEQTRGLWTELLGSIRSDEELLVALWSPVTMHQSPDNRTCDSR
jgi:hypothetical protein